MEEGTQDDDQAWRQMLEASWKSTRRKGSASKTAAAAKAPQSSAVASASSASVPSSVSETATGGAEVTPAAQPAKKTGLGSWSRLLSRASVPSEPSLAEPETLAAPSDPIVPEASAKVDEADDEEMEVDIGTFLNSCWKKASRTAVSSEAAGVPAAEVAAADVNPAADAVEAASSPAAVAEGTVGTDEAVVEDLDADEPDEAREVDESDLLGEEGEEAMQDGEIAEEDGREVGEADVEPMPSDVVIIDIEDDDDDAAGAEFRQALDELQGGDKTPKLMESKTVAKATQPSGPPPKHLQGNNVAGKKHLVPPSAMSAATAAAKQILVRTHSGHVGEPPRCRKGHHLKHQVLPGNTCDECRKMGTAWRCGSGCDYDVCMPCYSKKVNRNPAWKAWGGGGTWPNSQGAKQPAGSQIRMATPLNAGGSQIRPGMPPNAGAKQGPLIPAWRGIGNNAVVAKGASILQHGRTFSAPAQPVSSSWGGKPNFPKAAGIVRTNSAPVGRAIQKVPASGNSGPILPVGQAGNNLKRGNSWQLGSQQENTIGKRARTDAAPLAAVDAEGRRYNLNTIVVNFANVGASYAKKVLKREPGDKMLFDWEGVRRCVMYLTKNLGVTVVGVIYENFWATDNTSSPSQKTEIPIDIRRACESIEETPRIIGDNHKSADDEMTIKCAYHRNCRFMDNDNYRDWKQQLRDKRCQDWLAKCQDLLHMRYYFDSSMGVFETLDGNVPPGLLAPTANKERFGHNEATKRQLWTLPNK